MSQILHSCVHPRNLGETSQDLRKIPLVKLRRIHTEPLPP